MAFLKLTHNSFGFHNSLVSTFPQVFKNASLDVNVPTVAESSQDVTQDH